MKCLVPMKRDSELRHCICCKGSFDHTVISFLRASSVRPCCTSILSSRISSEFQPVIPLPSWMMVNTFHTLWLKKILTPKRLWSLMKSIWLDFYSLFSCSYRIWSVYTYLLKRAETKDYECESFRQLGNYGYWF